MNIKLRDLLSEACWDGYRQDGMKNKGGRQVPNCVPVNENETQSVECEKCGWEWDLEDGGKTPYVCHKCGHDNTEDYDELDVEDDDMEDFIQYLKGYTNELQEANCNCVFEAEYQGRDVKLGKPMQGDVKKFKVYVKNPAGNIVKVNFGHGGTSAASKGEKTMRIRKSNPKARKSFRARHNCDQPGPRHKARYWSCRKW
jgi:DNA-directed RNA polymerase subunit RPC12/RpoP